VARVKSCARATTGHGVFFAARHLKRQQAAEPVAHLAPGQRVRRMRFETGVVHGLDRAGPPARNRATLMAFAACARTRNGSVARLRETSQQSNGDGNGAA
jgi:hypothetical protein